MACALASGCTRSSVVDARATSPEAVAQAEQIFASRCAKCHGAKGKGDGPEAAKLNPRPRNFSDPTWHLAVSDRLGMFVTAFRDGYGEPWRLLEATVEP